MANVNQLFKAFDPEKKKRLSELLDGINRGAQVEIAQPVVAPSPTNLSAQPLRGPEMPQDPPIQTFGGLQTAPAGNARLFSQPAPAASPAPRTAFQDYDEASGVPYQPEAISDYEQASGVPYEYSGGSAVAPTNEPPSAKTSKQLIGGREAYKDPHKHSLLGRLFKAAGKGVKNWWEADAEGGLFGLLGHTIAGVAKGSTAKGYEDMEWQGQEKRLFKRLGMEQQQEAFNAKQQTEQMQQANYGNQIATRTAAEGRNAANTNSLIVDRESRRYMDAIKMAREEAKRKIVETNGKLYKEDAYGNREPLIDPETGQQATELTKVPIATTLADDTPIYTTGDKALDREITQNLNQARMDFEAKKLNQADLDKHESEIADWATKEAQRKQANVKLVADGEALYKQSEAKKKAAEAADDPDDKIAFETEAAELYAKGEALIRQSNNSKPLPKPKRPSASLEAPSIGAKTATTADVEAYAAQKKITPAVARKLFEKQGYRIR